MYKKKKGYFTLEASFILPIILFLYLLIILTALFLYCRSAISQNDFLLAMRAGRFTWGENDYGEAIYGSEERENWNGTAYVEERLERMKNFYPFFSTEAEKCYIEEEWVWVESRQRGSKEFIRKRIRKWNPVKIIRKWRVQSNA